MATPLASCSSSLGLSRVWNGGLDTPSLEYLRVVNSVMADEASLDVRRRPVVYGYIGTLLAIAKEWVRYLTATLDEDHAAMQAVLKANPGGSPRAIAARYDAVRCFYHLLVSRWIQEYQAYLAFVGVSAKPTPLAGCLGGCALSLAVLPP